MCSMPLFLLKKKRSNKHTCKSTFTSINIDLNQMFLTHYEESVVSLKIIFISNREQEYNSVPSETPLPTGRSF